MKWRSDVAAPTWRMKASMVCAGEVADCAGRCNDCAGRHTNARNIATVAQNDIPMHAT